MSLDSILEKLKEESLTPEVKDMVVQDYGSDSEIETIYSYSDYTRDDFEDDDGDDDDDDDVEMSHGFPIEGKIWQEVLENYIEAKYDEFESDFERHAKMENGKLLIYRHITVESIPRFIYFLNKGKSIPGFKGLGCYWSWDKKRAEAHWGYGKYTKNKVEIEGLVDINDINYRNTIAKNLNADIGDQEAEVELKPKAHVIIKNVISANKKIWSGEVKVEAKVSFMQQVKSKYIVEAANEFCTKSI